MKRIVFLNGKFIDYKNAKISIEDRGFQFSDSVYEVVALKNNKLIDLELHLKRLKNSLKFLNIKYKFLNNDLKKIFYNLIKSNKLQKGLIYMQVTRGIQPREHAYKNNLKPTVIIYTIKKNFNDDMNNLIAKTAITFPDLRWKRRDIKSVSLLANVLAAKEAKKNYAYEAILIDNGYVTEATASNIWIVKNNYLITHPANSNILRGITRETIKKLIIQNKLKLVEQKTKINSLYKADEVFLTSSSSFVTPIIKIDNKIINKGKIGNISKKLAKLYIEFFE